jgi:poly-gamma-glutamate synthesis protein (capsule biosynthesis protein)
MKNFNEFIESGEVAQAKTSVDVICVGDIFPGRNVEHKALGLGYGYPFAKIGDHLTCDVLMGNLEGVVDDIYGTQIRLKTTPRLSMSKSWLPELKKLGFSIVNVANNHFNDYGYDGIINTLRELSHNQINSVGLQNQRWIESQCGIDIGFLGCIDNESFKYCDYLINLTDIESEIKMIKEDCDHVIVNIHMGTEYADKANQKQMDVAHRCIDAGASAVIMHHAHVIQEIEHYNGGFIAYGLGNWCFDQDQPGTQQGLSVKMTFEKSGLKIVQTSRHNINDYVIEYDPWQVEVAR